MVLLEWKMLLCVTRTWGSKVHSKSTDHKSLLKHPNIDFAFLEEGGGDTYLKSDF